MLQVEKKVCVRLKENSNIFNIFDKYYNRRVTILEFFVYVTFLKFVTYQTTALEFIKSHLKDNCCSGRNNH